MSKEKKQVNNSEISQEKTKKKGTQVTPGKFFTKLGSFLHVIFCLFQVVVYGGISLFFFYIVYCALTK